MLKLSDQQMDAVLRAAQPLARVDRADFLEAVAARLAGTEPGDGEVFRVVREEQRRFFSPPNLSRSTARTKYERRQHAR
jgi:hypothetical protein